MSFIKDLTRAYVLIMLTMALATGLTVHEAHRADRELAKMTRGALVEGLRSGCEELTNPTRQATQAAISELEILAFERKDLLPLDPITGENSYQRARDATAPINCDFYASERARFMRLPGE